MKWENNYKQREGNKLYRFLGRNHLFDFLETGNIWFSRADRFLDKMECASLEDLKRGNTAQIRQKQKKFLINCWHLASKDSLAMWSTYSSKWDSQRVGAICFNPGTLFQYLETAPVKLETLDARRFIMGKVKYKALLDERNPKNTSVKYVAIRKENAFTYEQEFRFCIHLNYQFPQKGLAYSLGSPMELEFGIVINPLLPKKEKNIIIGKIKEMAFCERIEKSCLENWFN